MKCSELLELCAAGRKRCHLVGTEAAGVVIGLDLEGRLFAVLNGEILNLVNPKAVLGTSNRDAYLNPGGDGLWPAPEGSCLGYEYASGRWRVPPGVSGARYWIKESTPAATTIRAEIDLINASSLGVPAAFERRVSLAATGNSLTMTVVESIEYLGARRLQREECLLAPWTLAQFDCGPGCEVVFPAVAPAGIWDLYDPSDDQRCLGNDHLWHTRTDGGKRYQIGINDTVEWIEYRDPRRDLVVRRSAERQPPMLAYIDIADRPPPEKPQTKWGTRFSVYSDPAGFMEIEAAGGSPMEMLPGQTMALMVQTVYSIGTQTRSRQVR